MSSERLARPSEALSAFESDEEDRFFSQPPDFCDDTSPSQYAPAEPVVAEAASTPSEPVVAPDWQRERASSPALQARRARLQRVVVGALCASLVLLFVAAVTRHRAEILALVWKPSSPAAHPLPMLAAALPAVEVPPAVTPPPEPTRVASVAPEAAAVIPAAESAPSSDPPTVDDPATLVRTARVLLESGHVREGVATARSAVEADPADAEPYILLAAGLQDLGNWTEARTVFQECQKNTRRGASTSCRYFARR